MDITNVGAPPPPAVVKPAAPLSHAEVVEQIRRERIPFNGKEQKLAVNNFKFFEGTWHLHWFNDENGRIERAMQAGYRHVQRQELVLNEAVTPLNNDLGSNVRVAVGGGENGEPLYAYLMKLPQEIYEEDQAAQQAIVDRIDTAISEGVSSQAFASADDPEKAKATAYVKPGMIKQTTSTVKLKK